MNDRSGNTVFVNAKVRAYADERAADAILFSKEGILAVGGEDEVMRQATSGGVRRVDLRGRTVFPGFYDSHIHLVETAKVLQETWLGEVRSVEEMVALGREDLPRQAGGPSDWILGRGWNQENLAEKRYPTRHDLDRICADRPMLYQRCCGIVGVLNSKGLEMMGIDEHFSIYGGLVDKDDAGKALGVVRREALDGWVKKRLPQLDKARAGDLLKTVTPLCAAAGLTSVQSDDLTFYPNPEKLEALYLEAAEAGTLAIRVGQQYLLRDLAALTPFVARGRRTGQILDAGGRFSVGPLKIIVDGSLGSRTAALRADYADAPGERGLFVHTDEELRAMMCLAHENGLQMAVHCIGDAATEKVLDIVEGLQTKQRGEWRHRIVHCQIGDPALYARMARLGVDADVQPPFVASDGFWVADRVGSARAATSYAWKTLQTLGVRLGGSSDSPVETFAPLWGVQTAVTRADRAGNPPGGWLPEQCLRVAEALYLYTAGSAAVCGESARKGTLEPGKVADLTVLDEDPFGVAPNRIADIPVALTVSGGEAVYRRNDAPDF